MTDEGLGDFFIGNAEDDTADEEDELLSAPVIVPVRPPVPAASTPIPPSEPTAVPSPRLAPPAPPVQPAPPAQPVPASQAPHAQTPSVQTPEPAPVHPPQAGTSTREQRVEASLNALMSSSPDVQAAALITLDGFPMASALPTGMHEDRVAAMSAAILALGERAATELGRGRLSQVFIEGGDGYVLLMSAGRQAVLTVLASARAKLGLVLYDMRNSAEEIGGIIG